MKGREAARLALDALEKAGSEKSVVEAHSGEVKELNIEGGRFTLLRSTFNTGLSLTSIIEDRKGAASINRFDRDSIRGAAAEAVATARSSKPDPANDIAERQEPREFACGIDKPDLDLMYERLEEFLDHVASAYPHTILEQSILKFVAGESWFLNSNGVAFSTKRGHYDFEAMFTTKEGGSSSSFNSTGFSSNDLDVPIWERGSVERLIRQSSGQVKTTSVRGKYTGDIILTPDSVMSVLGFLTHGISDIPLITGTSVFKDKLGEKIAPEVLTVHSSPLSGELVKNYFVTGDGYPAGDCTIVNGGTLTSFLLSLYGARKTGGKRSVSGGGCFIVEPGGGSFEDLVKSVSKGILVCRISGGHPGDNGDFSGIAKNSYLIENGEITEPVSETMISGNAAGMLREIRGISKDRVNFGGTLLPWIQFGGLTISGK